MVSPVRDYGSTSRAGSGSTDDSTLAELRERVTEIAREVATIAEKRTRAARETAEAGAIELRRTIRRQPVVSMAVAIGVGALLALALVPRFGRSSAASRWDSWIPSMPVTRADLYDMTDSIQRSVSRAAHAVPGSVTPAFERFVDALTRTDPSASVGSLLEKASGWFQKAQAKAKEKVG